MTIQDVYDQYRIMPALQQHMYRVAGVAQVICDHLTVAVDTTNVVSACLLHDLGNILKFDLTKFPHFLEPQGLKYWQNVEAEFKSRYGNDEQLATMAMAREIGVSARVHELIEAVGFDNIQQTLESGDLGKMICEYADARVTPFGVTSLEERLADLEQRYGVLYSSPEHVEKRKKFAEIARQMEDLIFNQVPIMPKDITDEVAEKIVMSDREV